MNDRRRTGTIVLAAGACLLAVGAALWLRGLHNGGGAAAPLRGGNVVLVTLDTTRADHLGCYGGDAGATPSLDALAEDGVLFAQAQSAAPITLPAHVSMLTGLYPLHHGVRNNGMFALSRSVPTLATLLRERGYHTGAFVSAYVLARRYGLDNGFDVYSDDLSRGSQAQRYTVPSRRGGITVDEALRWLEGLPAGEPFLLWVHLYDPHAPYDPPEEFRRRFPTNPYKGEIAYADAMVGRLLAGLHRRGDAAGTIVTVVGDHGEALGEHGEQTHAILLHQATLHVPWVVSAPNLPHGARVQTAVSIVDVLPTLLELVGVAPPPLDGRSAVPLLTGGRRDEEERSLYAETLLPRYQYGWSPLRSLRRGRWELVSGARDELFDLRRDPRELASQVEREPERVRALRSVLDGLVGDDHGADATPPLDLSQSELDALRSLGYLGAGRRNDARSADPRDLIRAHVHMEKARSLAATARWEESLSELDALLQQDPDNLAALMQRAQALVRMRRPDEARRVLDRALAVDPEEASLYRLLAQIELTAGRADRALELARAGAGRRGAFASLDVVEATALVALGRTSEARALITARLVDRPDDPELLTSAAGLRLAAGDRGAGESLLRRAVEIDALHLPARLALASVLQASGRSDEAGTLLEDFLKIDPANPEALRRLGALWLDEPVRARPYLEEAVRLDPGDASALASLGVCYLRLDDHEAAIAAFRRALAADAGNLEARNNLGIALTLRGRLSEAEAELREVLAARPAFAEAHNNLALCLHYQRRYAEAEREARRALKLRPGMVDARLTLAAVLTERGETAEAERLLEALHDEDPANVEVAARLGLLLDRRGECARALPLLRTARERYAESLDVLGGLARCAERVGDSAEAARAYERIARLAPPGPDRDRAVAAARRLAAR